MRAWRRRRGKRRRRRRYNNDKRARVCPPPLLLLSLFETLMALPARRPLTPMARSRPPGFSRHPRVLAHGDDEDGDAVLEAVAVDGVQAARDVAHELLELLVQPRPHVGGLRLENLVLELLKDLRGEEGK